MNPRYAFLKLDASISSPLRIGRPDIASEDVLLACAGLPRSRFLYGVVVWLGDNKDLPELTRLAMIESMAKREVRENHSRLPYKDKKNVLKAMIVSALEEHQTSMVCKTCNGRAEVTSNHRIIKCEKCDGTGRKPRSNRNRAVALGKDSRSYDRYWKNTYETIYYMFCDWEQEIIIPMKRRLAI